MNTYSLERIEQVEGSPPYLENIGQIDISPAPDYVFSSIMASGETPLIFSFDLSMSYPAWSFNDRPRLFSLDLKTQELSQIDTSPAPDYVFASDMSIGGPGIFMAGDNMNPEKQGTGSDFYHHF
jgi:hypothetical protein